MTGFYIWKRNKSKCDHIWTRLRHKWAVVNKMIIVPKNSMYTLSVVIVMSGLANMLIATITTWVNVTNHVSALKFSCKCVLKTLFSLKLSSKTLWPASCGILMCADRPGSWRDWTSEWNKREHHVVIWNEDAGNNSDLRQTHPGCGSAAFFPGFSECKMGLTEEERAPWHSVHSQTEPSFDL